MGTIRFTIYAAYRTSNTQIWAGVWDFIIFFVFNSWLKLAISNLMNLDTVSVWKQPSFMCKKRLSNWTIYKQRMLIGSAIFDSISLSDRIRAWSGANFMSPCLHFSLCNFSTLQHFLQNICCMTCFCKVCFEKWKVQSGCHRLCSFCCMSLNFWKVKSKSLCSVYCKYTIPCIRVFKRWFHS